MSYNFTKASDLVKWAKVQLENPNYYKNGGIGRYEGKYRTFDCCGLFKCFMWHDYNTNNSKYYNKTQKDLNCEGLIAEAKEKGSISSIPEIPGVLVYQKGHMGIYIGNGEVIESTAKKYDGKQGKIYKTYFKGKHTGYKRTSWTHWFKSPYLTYNKVECEKVNKDTKESFFDSNGYFGPGDTHKNIGKIAKFMRSVFPVYTSEKALGNYYGKYIQSSIKEFQKRTGLETDGCVGPITLAELKKYGFKE